MGSPAIWFGTAVKLLKSQLKIPGSTSGTWTLAPAAAVTDYTTTMPAAQGGVGQTFVNKDAAGTMVWASIPNAAKNYLSAVVTSNGTNTGNGDLESGDTTGWVKGNIPTLATGLPTSTSPTFGSGSSGNLSIASVSSSQLSGSFSLSYASSAATTAGDCLASAAFFIDTTDQAKVLTFKFAYKAFSNGSNANWSGTSSNSFGVAIWDVTNSVWIIPAGVFAMVQSAGIGYCTGQFQTSATGTSYRLVIYNANATTGAITVYFDDFSVSPIYATGVIPKNTTYTVLTSGSGSYTPPTGCIGLTVRMVGGGQGGAASGTSPGAQGSGGDTTFGSFTATGATTRTGATASGGDVNINGGTGSSRPGGTTNAQGGAGGGTPFGSGGGSAAEGGPNAGIAAATNSGAGGGGASSAGTATCGSGGGGGAYIEKTIAGPLAATYSYGVGAGGAGATLGTSGAAGGNAGSGLIIVEERYLGTNVQMSADTDTRVVAAIISGDPASATSGNPIIVPTVGYDSHAAYSNSTGRYTVPVSGIYKLFGALQSASSATTLTIYKNAVSTALAGNLDSNGEATFAGAVNCVAGDIIDLRPGGTVDATSMTLNIERLSGPAVVAMSESVNMRYHGSNTASVTNSADITLDVRTKDYDTHSAWSNTVFTAPVTGKYAFKVNVEYTGFSSAGAFSANITSLKNGATWAAYKFTYPASVNDVWGVHCSDTVSMNAGDTLGFTVRQNTGSTQTVGNVVDTYVAIERIGS